MNNLKKLLFFFVACCMFAESGICSDQAVDNTENTTQKSEMTTQKKATTKSSTTTEQAKSRAKVKTKQYGKKTVQSFKIKIKGKEKGSVCYSAWNGRSWTKYKKNNQRLKCSNMQGIRIKLTGKLKKHYNIYYRVKVQGYGWLGFGKNGSIAGNENYKRKITKIQVILLKKGEQDIRILFSDEPRWLDRSNMILKVNKRANVVTVYQGSKPIKAFTCSTGGDTPIGKFRTGVKYRWRALFHHCYGQYTTQIHGNILFHSVPYDTPNKYRLQREEYNKLGTSASAGCVRLRVCDAKWIYDNCGPKTKVIIYKNNNPGPLGKPEYDKLPSGINYDPTDPSVQ